MIVGLLGGGQLGRMLALAGYPLGLRFRFFDLAATAPAGQLAELIVARSFEEFESSEAFSRFAAGLTVGTAEFEHIPASLLRRLSSQVQFFPPPMAFETAQDRLLEKRLFQRLGIPTAQFRAVADFAELEAGCRELGFPVVLKTRRHGYDGKGQIVLRDAASLQETWQRFAGMPLLLEAVVSFQRELSIISVRSRTGDVRSYPLIENEHRDGILRLSRAPAANVSATIAAEANSYAQRLMDALEYVGVLTIELFEDQGRLLANEFAPRVHNSGHWTIEGAQTSQFANHLRAILGMPLGATEPIGVSAMINLIGQLPVSDQILAVPGANLHLYAKSPAPARKLGHITVVEADPSALEAKLSQLSRIMRPES